MSRRFLKTCLATCASVTLFALAPAALAQKTIKFANQNAKGHPIVQGMEKFAEIVAAKSKGALKVNVFPSGTLGSDQANVSALQGGRCV